MCSQEPADGREFDRSCETYEAHHAIWCWA